MDLRSVDAPPTAGPTKGHNHFDRDAKVNPLMFDWTMIYLPYCDGQSFAGDNVSATTPPLHFRGKAIREATVASLRATAGLAQATAAVVTGCSAGGAAAYFHTDWFAAQLPQAKTRGMPDSGWFLDGACPRGRNSE